MSYWRGKDGRHGLKRDNGRVWRTGLVGLDGDEIDDGTSAEEGSDEVDAIGDGGECGVEDGLSHPDEEGEVDEDIDQRSVGYDHPDKDIEEVISITHLPQPPPLLLSTFGHSSRTIHIIIIFRLRTLIPKYC